MNMFEKKTYLMNCYQQQEKTKQMHLKIICQLI